MSQEIGKTGLWTTVIGALLMLIDGILAAYTGAIYGFWTIGAWIALIGGILIAYRK